MADEDPDVPDCDLCEQLANCGTLFRVSDRVDFQTLMLRILCEIVKNTAPPQT